MAKQDAAALRAARETRIASRAAGTQSNDKAETKTENVSTPATAKTAAPASSPAVLTAAVVDPQSVAKTANIDLVLYGEKTENPHWIVLASGKPVAEIRLEDQEESSKIARVFVTNGYAEGIRDAVKQFPFAEVLAGVRARPYTATVANSDAFKAIESQVKEATHKELRKAKSELRDAALNMLNLVVVAQTKNFLQENPLKDELFRRMTESGIEDRRAVALIEAAFQARAPEHFEACFKQAFKWMDLQPEALSELAEQIKGLGYRTPVVAESDEIRSAAARQVHNIPLETRTAATIEDDGDKSALREVFAFRSRNLSHDMRNR